MGNYQYQYQQNREISPEYTKEPSSLLITPASVVKGTLFQDAAFMPPYFWGTLDSNRQKAAIKLPVHRGYTEARSLIGDGSLKTLEHLTEEAQKYISSVFDGLQEDSHTPSQHLVELRLSDDLQKWRDEQFKAGRVLPCKLDGIKRVSDKVLLWFGAENWPEPLVTGSAIFGVGIANMLIGAYDARTLYSNYCTDMVFYYEHGYDKVFPGFEELIRQHAHDPHALQTPAGVERRAGVEVGMRYVRGKIELEVKNKSKLVNKAAKLDRRTAQIVFFCDSSLLGVSAESIARGFDPAAVMSDMIFSSPGTDVVDVGSDLINSEVMNSFLNTDDISGTGVVTEKALLQVYDAYAHIGGRIFVERWMEPTGRMCAMLYTWHIQNGRHCFCRRALLGYPKVRKGPFEQREADFDEAFDEKLHTTGFSRPIEGACNGGDICDAVEKLLHDHQSKDILAELWRCISTAPLEYVRKGVVDQATEQKISEDIDVIMAKAFHFGLILELSWTMSHASHHAWQVNHLFEAAMFGSLLDDGGLKGKLDRKD